MKISITEPCHENWDAMTPNAQGAFCKSCAKDVVDFSKKSLDEIKNFFNQPQTGRVCGRFEEKQLQELSVEDFISRFTYWNFSKKFAAIFFMAFGFWIFSNQSAMAQYDSHMKGEVMIAPDRNPKQETTKTPAHPEPERRMIKGKVAKRETCIVKTVSTEPTVKGNAKVDPVKNIEENHMMMGMIAFNPNREKTPVVTKQDTTVKGDTIAISNHVTEIPPIDNAITETPVNTIEETTVAKPDSSLVENTVAKTIETDKTISETKILVYPNPNAGNFVIESPVKQTVNILDENGKIVLTQIIEGATSIEASHLRAGVYYVNLLSAEGRVTKKVIITK